MALPGDLATVVCTGTFLDPAGSPLRGTVSFTPSVLLPDPGDSVIIAAIPRTYELAGGSFTSDPLLATDSGQVVTPGWTYTVTVSLQNAQPYSFSTFLLTEDSPVDISELTPLTPVVQMGAYLPITGGTMLGPLYAAESPVAELQVATKGYVDAITAGLSAKDAVRVATTGALPANTYSNGTAGVGATLTANMAGTLTVDTVSPLSIGDRVLVKNEGASSAAQNNGIYEVSAPGSSMTPWVLTRTSDMDTDQQIPGAYTFVQEGTANAGFGFIVSGIGPYALGVTAISWEQFTSTGDFTAGTGLTLSGDVVSLNVPVTIADGGTGAGTGVPAAQNDVFAGPASGGSGSPSFRPLAAPDLPVATTGAQGAVQLAGDLGGTAAGPQVLKIQGTAITAPPTGGAVLTEFLRGDGTWDVPPGSGITLAGDLGNTDASPWVVSTHLPSPGLPVNQGGTGSETVPGAPYAGKPATTSNFYYVSADASASDSNDGLSWGSAKASVAGALTALGSSSGTIQLGAGTFTIATADGNGSPGNAVTLPNPEMVLRGMGHGLTIIKVTTAVTWGIVCLGQLSEVAELQLSIGTGGSATYGVGVSTPNKSSGSNESCRFTNVYVYLNGGTITNSFGVGPDTAGAAIDIAETVFTGCGSRAAASNAGFLVGNGTSGNILNTTMLACTAVSSAFGAYGNASPFIWVGGNAGENTCDFYANSEAGGPYLIQGVRSENSGQLFASSVAANTPMGVAIRDVTWNAGEIISSGKFISHGMPGTLTLDNVFCRASPSGTPPFIFLDTTGYLTVTASCLFTAAPVTSLFGFSGSQIAGVINGYTQGSAAGLDPPVAITAGPVSLNGTTNITTVSGVTFAGGASLGQALVATSSSAADWQTISGVGPVSDTTLGAGLMGYAAWTGDPCVGAMARASATFLGSNFLASGNMVVALLPLAASSALNGYLSWYWAAETSGSPAHAYVGIYNPAGTLLWSSADLSAVSGPQRQSTGITSWIAGSYYIATYIGTNGTVGGGPAYFSLGGDNTIVNALSAGRLSSPWRTAYKAAGALTGLPGTLTLGSGWTNGYFLPWFALD